MCADVVAWTNDLRDAGPRPAAGEATLIDVLARERTLGRGEAAALVREMTEERLDDFETAAGRLTARHAHAEDVRARIDRVRTFLYGAVAWQHESGRYRAGLVLETALLPALLRVRGRHPEEQRELTAWLDGRREGADPLDGLLIDCCLRPHTLPADAATAARTVTGGPGTGTAGLKTAGLGTVGVETAGSEAEGTGVGGRGRLKRSMPHAVLHLLGGLRLTGEDTPAPMPAQGLPTYTTVHLLAVRVLYAQATGYPHAVTTGERFHLADLRPRRRGRRPPRARHRLPAPLRRRRRPVPLLLAPVHRPRARRPQTEPAARGPRHPPGGHTRAHIAASPVELRSRLNSRPNLKAL